MECPPRVRPKRGRVHIHAPRQIGIRLRGGDGADGGAVNDELRPVFLELAANGVAIEQIQLVARQRAHAPVRSKSRRGLDKIISNQPVRASDPGELHAGKTLRTGSHLPTHGSLTRLRHIRRANNVTV